MNLVFDIVNTLLTVWLKPVLVIALMMYVVNKPDFRSAATNHWLLLLAVVSPMLCIVFFLFLPRIDIGILPTALAVYTQAKVFSPTQGLFAHPNLLTLIFVTVYLAGVSYLLGRLAAALRQTRELARHSEPLSSPALTKLQSKLATEFSLSNSVEIRVSKQLASPVVWGYVRPQIILPVQSSNWRVDRMQRVLAHEYAHIARGDWLSKLCSHLLCAFFWINPLMWKAARQCAWHAELACDDLVINKLQCRAEYADDLLELSTDACHQSLATLGFIKKSELYLRINAILDGGKNRNAPGYALKALLFGLVVVLLLPLSVLQAKQSPYTLRDQFIEPAQIVKVYDLDERTLVLDEYTNDYVEQVGPAYLTPEQLKQRYMNAVSTDMAVISPLRSSLQQHAKLNVKQNTRVYTSIHTSSKLEFDTVEVTPPRPLKVVTPKYPERALYRNLEATVVVALDVDLEGRVHNPRIVSSDHSRVFNPVVLRAIKDFVYQPMMIDGQPIITRNVIETFVFTLKDTTDT